MSLCRGGWMEGDRRSSSRTADDEKRHRAGGECSRGQAVGQVGPGALEQQSAENRPDYVSGGVDEVLRPVGEAARPLREGLVEPGNGRRYCEAEARSVDGEGGGRSPDPREDREQYGREGGQGHPGDRGATPSASIPPPAAKRRERGIDRDRRGEQEADRRAREPEARVAVERGDDLDQSE